MIITKNDFINYYACSNAFHNYVCYNAKNYDMNPELIKDIEKIRIARVSLLATFFACKKEELVEKKENLNNESKILDEIIEEIIKEIAIYNNGIYKIGDLEESNPSNILAFIRNKFGHGCYEVDTDNSEVIFNNDGTKIRIKIDKLHLIACQAMLALIKYPKTSVIKRAYIQGKYIPRGPFKNDNEVIKYLETSTLYIYKFRKKDGSLLTKEDEDEINAYYEWIKKEKQINPNSDNIQYINQIFEKVSANYGIQLDIERPKIKKTDTIDKIMKLIKIDTDFYNLENVIDQITFIGNHAIYNMVDNYYEEDYLTGIIKNLELLSKMEETNNINIEFLVEDSEHIDAITTQVSSLIANYNSLFIYPLETVLIKNKKSLSNENPFDFSKLDLDIIKPKVLEISKKNLEEALREYQSAEKNFLSCGKEIDKIKEHLNKALEKDSKKGIEIQQENLKDKFELQKHLYDLMIEKLNNYKEIENDYIKNSKYYENKTKIEYIRHAIFHNNVKVKRFECKGLPSDTVLNFTDYDYDGDKHKVFDLDITIDEFSQIFKQENIEEMIKFSEELKNKQIKKEIKEDSNILNRIKNKVLKKVL